MSLAKLVHRTSAATPAKPWSAAGNDSASEVVRTVHSAVGAIHFKRAFCQPDSAQGTVRTTWAVSPLVPRSASTLQSGILIGEGANGTLIGGGANATLRSPRLTNLGETVNHFSATQ